MFYKTLFKEAKVDTVDISEEMIKISKEFFGYDGEVISGDAH